VSDADVERWVQSASVLHSNRDALDIAVKDGRIVGVRGRRACHEGGTRRGGIVRARPGYVSPMATTPQPAEQTDLRSHLAERGLTVAVAESLTGGLLASRFARTEGASDWFRGAVVAYSARVKHRLLGVRPGPVVSREAAVDMARGARRLLDADVAVAVTGVGGPEPQDDLPPGTVWVAVAAGDCEAAELYPLEGDPTRVCAASCDAAIALLLATVDGIAPGPPRRPVA
jgi:nicotinamide-nucleotide amidase